MNRPLLRSGAAALVIFGILASSHLVRAAAPSARPEAAKPTPAKGAGPGVPLLPGAGSKEPVNIDADKLDYFDKDQKLIYTGDVVAVQGESTLKASVLTIFLQKDAQGQGGATAPTPNPAPAGGANVGPAAGSSVKHMEADGPVTLISKDQVGTGNHATYDKAENKVYLTGNVTLSQGTNVTQGDHLIYDLTTGQAQVFSGTTNARVKSVFTPGSGTTNQPPAAAKSSPKPDKPTPHRPAKAQPRTRHTTAAQ